MSITKELFGKTMLGKDVYIFTLTNSNGSNVKVINYGATVASINVPDKNGKLTDVELGFDTIEGYEKQNFYMGAALGRCANRIENSCFKINGVEYKLTQNEGNNQLHGGINGFDRKLWDYNIIDDKLELTYLSKDGEEGYPGNLNVKITFTFDDSNRLTLKYEAVADKDTLINLSHHCYFNLGGHDSGLITDHMLKLYCSSFTPANKKLIPTSEFINCENTPMNFKEFTAIGEHINDDYNQLNYVNGYDINFVIDGWDKSLKLAAELHNKTSGIIMKTYTNMPGLQFYTGNFLNCRSCGKNGASYTTHSALCLEAQYYPNAVNIDNFMSPVYKANEKYFGITAYEFSVTK